MASADIFPVLGFSSLKAFSLILEEKSPLYLLFVKSFSFLLSWKISIWLQAQKALSLR